MNGIRLILWKNARLRLYHPMLTCLEICFPVFVFYQGIIFYNAFQESRGNGTLYPLLEEQDLYHMFQTLFLIIAYVPENKFTSSLMNKTMGIFGSYDIPSHLLLILPVENETQLEILFTNKDYLRNHTKGKGWLAFAVIFESISPTTNELRYRIRTSKEQLRNKDTRFLYPREYVIPDVTTEDDYIKSGFVGLEYALNRAFMTTKFGSVKFPKMNIQQFPYPGLNGDQFPEEIIYFLSLIGFIFLAMSVPHYIASERQSGMKELMKVAGIPEWLVWFGWITYSLMIYPISISVITVILTTELTTKPFYENISPVLVWIIFMLYCIAVLIFLFAVGTLFTKHWVAVTVSVIMWFLSSSKWIISIVGDIDDFREKFIAIPLLCLLPNLVLFNAFRTLEYFEFKGVPTSISAFLVDIVDPHILHLRYILFLFMINMIINGCIIFYISAIHPGRYGRKKHILFMFSKIIPYCERKIRTPAIEDSPNIDNEFFEKRNDNMTVSFRIHHLQKKYGFFHHSSALKDLNLEICEDDITVLIGHNGAGKTTLLNILSGMISETSGNVLFNNEDITVNRSVIRQQIGYCPQQNVHFSYLTVLQHLLFFAMIKGQNEYEALMVAQEILRTFRLENDHGRYVRELSAGAKRKLSLAMALIKLPKILILDEPTLGMDLISRRRIWALLKKIKEKRVILVTTQDMEEADLLGDRIAVMHDGQVFCYGSGLFLKTTFGTGYSMVLSKDPGFVTAATTAVVVSALPKATLQKDSDNYVSYKLPIQEKKQFPSLFKALESRKGELKISNIDVEYSTMEQLFLNVHNLATRKDGDKKQPVTPSRGSEELITTRRTGFSLILHQMIALLGARIKINNRRYNRILVCMSSAIILGFLSIKVINWSYVFLFDPSNPPLKLLLRAYTNAEVIGCFNAVDGTDKTPFVEELKDAYQQYVSSQQGISILTSKEDCQIQQILLEFNSHSPYEYKDNVVTAILVHNSSAVTVLYNGLILHSAPIAVNTYTNALMRTVDKKKESFTTVTSHPLVSSNSHTFCSVDLKTTYLTAVTWWIFIFYSAVICFLASFVAFIIVERIHGIHHLQTMSSLSGLTYWIGNFLFDYSYFSLIVFLLIITMKSADNYDIFSNEDAGAWLMILLLFGVSGIMYSYLFGLFFDSVSVFLLVNIPLNICVAICSIVFQIQESSNIFSKLEPFFALLPTYTFFNLMIRFLFVLINNNHCKYCLAWELGTCESNIIKIKYFKENDYTQYSQSYTDFSVSKIMQTQIYRLVYYSFAHIVICTAFLTLVNSPFGKRLWSLMITHLLRKEFEPRMSDSIDRGTTVESEIRHVKELNRKQLRPENVLIVDGIKTNILYRFTKFSPVKDLSFIVSIQQCFGLVGGNGAGKSTAFKILTANLFSTAGDVILHGVSMVEDLKKYLSFIGYCPQTNAIYDELTAREMLALFATLRGLQNPQVHVDKWISILGIEHYQNRYIDTYSSGNKRKLCIGLSMIGYPLAVYLDEPSAGIDPSSRRKIYRAIRRAKRSNQIVVIASHNFRECEDLCDRVSIIQSGTLKRIGTVSELKQTYAVGFTIIVKLHPISDYDKLTDLLTAEIIATFGKSCNLKDRRLGLFHFVVTDSKIKWSYLFSGMEQIKMKHVIVDDFIISNSTIDDFFVASSIKPYTA